MVIISYIFICYLYYNNSVYLYLYYNVYLYGAIYNIMYIFMLLTTVYV